MHPRSAADFDVLFRELESWRLHETARIKESGDSHESISLQLQDLLGKEVKLLQTIDRLKITAAKENKLQKTQATLEKVNKIQQTNTIHKAGKRIFDFVFRLF
jgi:hypothetical protein